MKNSPINIKEKRNEEKIDDLINVNNEQEEREIEQEDEKENQIIDTVKEDNKINAKNYKEEDETNLVKKKEKKKKKKKDAIRNLSLKKRMKIYLKKKKNLKIEKWKTRKQLEKWWMISEKNIKN